MSIRFVIESPYQGTYTTLRTDHAEVALNRAVDALVAGSAGLDTPRGQRCQLAARRFDAARFRDQFRQIAAVSPAVFRYGSTAVTVTLAYV